MKAVILVALGMLDTHELAVLEKAEHAVQLVALGIYTTRTSLPSS